MARLLVVKSLSLIFKSLLPSSCVPRIGQRVILNISDGGRGQLHSRLHPAADYDNGQFPYSPTDTELLVVW